MAVAGALACGWLCFDAWSVRFVGAGPLPWLRAGLLGAAFIGSLSLLGVVIALARRERDAFAAAQRRLALRALLDVMPVPVAVCIPGEAQAVLNRTMVHLLGIERGDETDLPFDWQALVHAADWPAWVAATELALQSGRAQWLRCTMRLGEKPDEVLAQIAPIASEAGIELAVSLTLPQGEAGLAHETILQLRDLLALAEAEKWHFGQAVHDELGQRLSGMAYFAKSLQRELEKAQRAEADSAAWLTDLANESMGVARDLARGLVPVGTDDAGALAAALAELCERASRSFDIECTLKADAEFDPGGAAKANHLYHATQELVTNSVKHGRALRVQIGLEVQADSQRITVRNDGIGLDAAPARFGMGLNGVRSRVAYLGAQFSLVNASPGGVLATIELPAAPRPLGKPGEAS